MLVELGLLDRIVADLAAKRDHGGGIQAWANERERGREARRSTARRRQSFGRSALAGSPSELLLATLGSLDSPFRTLERPTARPPASPLFARLIMIPTPSTSHLSADDFESVYEPAGASYSAVQPVRTLIELVCGHQRTRSSSSTHSSRTRTSSRAAGSASRSGACCPLPAIRGVPMT